MSRYIKLGELPPKRHIQFRQPDGSLYTEQVFGTRGFSGPMSTLYHIHMPTEVASFEDRGSVKVEYLEDGPLHHLHLKTRAMKPCGDAVSGRIPLLGNQDVVWNQVVVGDQMDYYYKDADGDEILFIHDGSGTLESLFGTLKFKEMDYIVIPKGTI